LDEMRDVVCPHCGHTIEIERAAEPRAAIEAGSGKPNVYVLRVGRHELHRCDLHEGRCSAS
jgi:hypothetical protein